jgi:hypothetical protein
METFFLIYFLFGFIIIKTELAAVKNSKNSKNSKKLKDLSDLNYLNYLNYYFKNYFEIEKFSYFKSYDY